jgi:hypothetical protein
VNITTMKVLAKINTLDVEVLARVEEVHDR